MPLTSLPEPCIPDDHARYACIPILRKQADAFSSKRLASNRYNACVQFRKVILASRSPRRVSLLRQTGIPRELRLQLDPPFADPAQPDHADPVSTALELAGRKADSALNILDWSIHAGALLIAADTIVAAMDGTLLGQPADRVDAQRMLRKIVNAQHRVITAVHLVFLPQSRAEASTFRRESFADQATVQIGKVGNQQLARYLDSNDWQGKAGAYNLAELEDVWPISVSGDPTTVVGLPMRRLLPYLTLPL